MSMLRCSITNHRFDSEPQYFTDERHLSFVRKVHKSFSSKQPVCKTCYNSVLKVFNDKYARAVERQRNLRCASVSSSRNTTSDESIDRTVQNRSRNRTPSNVTKRRYQDRPQINARQLILEDYSESNDENISNNRLSVPSLQSSEDIILSQLANIANSQSSLDQQPTTSAAAQAKRLQEQQQKTKSTPSKAQKRTAAETQDDEDDEFMPSLNALNGTRLPHIQPIPKRRQVVHANADIMEYFMSTNIGG